MNYAHNEFTFVCLDYLILVSSSVLMWMEFSFALMDNASSGPMCVELLCALTDKATVNKAKYKTQTTLKMFLWQNIMLQPRNKGTKIIILSSKRANRY